MNCLQSGLLLAIGLLFVDCGRITCDESAQPNGPVQIIRVAGSIKDSKGKPVKNTVYQIAVPGRADDALRQVDNDGNFEQRLQACLKFDIYFWAGDDELGVAPGIGGQQDVTLPIIYPDFFNKQSMETKRVALSKFANSVYVASKSPFTDTENNLYEKMSSAKTRPFIDSLYLADNRNEKDKIFGTLDFLKTPKANHGSITIRSGFLPDPYKKTLIAGGSIETKLGGVNAWISPRPDFQVNYSAGVYPLTFHVKSEANTTLLINLPNGKWVAADKGPFLRFPTPQSGRYDIWVGTREKNASAPAMLHVTELGKRD